MLKVAASRAFRMLTEGGVVVYPTDKLYAPGADTYNKMAVKRDIELKQRLFINPLSVTIPDINNVDVIAYMKNRSRRLMDGFLFGPLIVSLPKKRSITNIVTSGLNTVAIRIPDNMKTLDLFLGYGQLTATSTNVYGEKRSSFVEEIQKHFGIKYDIVNFYRGKLDGQPSTRVDLSDFDTKVVREDVLNKKSIWDAI